MFYHNFEQFLECNSLNFHWYKNAYKQKHKHTSWECFFLTEGETIHCCNGVKEVIFKGFVGVIRPNDEHYFEDIPGKTSLHFSVIMTDFLAMDIMNIVSSGLYNKITALNTYLKFNLDNNDFERLLKLINELNITTNITPEVQESNLPLAKLIAVNFFYLCFKYFDNISEKYPDWLSSFLQVLKNPDNIALQIQDLVQYSYFSYTHLRRLFKKYMHTNLSDYFLQIKLEYAKKLLVNSNYSILYICNSIGFSSLSYFNTTFKKHFLVTPYQYRTHFSSSSEELK